MLQPTSYIGPYFKHLVHSFPSHFECSVMKMFYCNVHYTKVSEVINEIFTCVTL